MQVREAVRMRMHPALEEGDSLGLKGPGSGELLGPRGLELRGTSSTSVGALTHCSTATSELKEEARDGEVGSRRKK